LLYETIYVFKTFLLYQSAHQNECMNFHSFSFIQFNTYFELPGRDVTWLLAKRTYSRIKFQM